MDEDLKQFLIQIITASEERLRTEMRAGKAETNALIDDLKESLERDIGELRSMVNRLAVRQDRIDAASKYLSRLSMWAEKHDAFQIEVWERLQEVEKRLRKLEGAA